MWSCHCSRRRLHSELRSHSLKESNPAISLGRLLRKKVSIADDLLFDINNTSSRPPTANISVSSISLRNTSPEDFRAISSALVPLVSFCSITHIALSKHASSYTGKDPIGIEIAGALKNVYAIAAGLADGLGFENNTRASKLFPVATRRLRVLII
jgi:hypothetical protein